MSRGVVRAKSPAQRKRAGSQVKVKQKALFSEEKVKHGTQVEGEVTQETNVGNSQQELNNRYQ